MRKILFTLSLCLSAWGAKAQTVGHRNPEIERLVSEVSSDSLKKYIYDLAAFNSRHCEPGLQSGDRAQRPVESRQFELQTPPKLIGLAPADYKCAAAVN